MVDPQNLLAFDVARADVIVQANFASEFWPIVHNIPAFYKALLDAFREEGLTARDFRNDAGDGSLGGFYVGFWVLNIRASVRVKLERVELEFRRLLITDIEPLSRVLAKLIGALQVAEPSLQMANYSVDAQLHGEARDVPAKDFARRFVTNSPVGLGASLGTGCVFYFAPPITSVTTDLSGLEPSKLYIRVVLAIDGAVPAAEVTPQAEGHIDTALAALGLRRVREA